MIFQHMDKLEVEKVSQFKVFLNQLLLIIYKYVFFFPGPSSPDGEDISPLRGLIPRVLDYLFWLIARENTVKSFSP